MALTNEERNKAIDVLTRHAIVQELDSINHEDYSTLYGYISGEIGDGAGMKQFVEFSDEELVSELNEYDLTLDSKIEFPKVQVIAK